MNKLFYQNPKTALFQGGTFNAKPKKYDNDKNKGKKANFNSIYNGKHYLEYKKNASTKFFVAAFKSNIKLKLIINHCCQ